MVTVAQVTEEHPVHWIYETKETAGPALSPYNRQLAISHFFHIAENSHVSVWMQTCCKKQKTLWIRRPQDRITRHLWNKDMTLTEIPSLVDYYMKILMI